MPKAKKREKAAKVFMIGFLLFVEPSCMLQNCRYRSSPKTQTVGPYAVAFFLAKAYIGINDKVAFLI